MFSTIVRSIKIRPYRAAAACRSIASLSNKQNVTNINNSQTVCAPILPSIKPTRFASQEREPTCFDVVDAEDYRERVLGATVPVIVDFHASWCGPCKVLGPLLEAAVDAHKGKVLLAKVDVDVNGEVAMEYEVSAVPTVLGINNGLTEDQFMGSRPKEEIEDFIHKLLEKK